MSRKHRLQQNCQAVFAKANYGSHATRREHYRLIQTICDDLAELKQLPHSFRQLTPDNIGSLVALWQKRGLTKATIGNKLAALRKFNQLAKLKIDIPSNRLLGSVKPASFSPNGAIPENISAKVHHPITLSVVNLQQIFGLTRLEAIRLRVAPAQNETNLIIHRQIAHNRQDRAIPIITESQRKCLLDRAQLEKASRLLQQNHDVVVGKLIEAELIEANLEPAIEIRMLYARNRLNVLRGTLELRTALLTLCSEMGFSTPKKIKQWLL